jgi:hypothetical protein
MSKGLNQIICESTLKRLVSLLPPEVQEQCEILSDDGIPNGRTAIYFNSLPKGMLRRFAETKIDSLGEVDSYRCIIRLKLLNAFSLQQDRPYNSADYAEFREKCMNFFSMQLQCGHSFGFKDDVGYTINWDEPHFTTPINEKFMNRLFLNNILDTNNVEVAVELF